MCQSLFSLKSATCAHVLALPVLEHSIICKHTECGLGLSLKQQNQFFVKHQTSGEHLCKYWVTQHAIWLIYLQEYWEVGVSGNSSLRRVSVH